MKILYVITKANEIGGAQKHILDLSHAFSLDSHHVDIAYGSHGLFANQLELVANKTFYIESLVHPISLSSDIKAVLSIRKLVKANSYDIVALHSSKAGIVGRLACIGLRDISVIFTAHSWAFSPGLSSKLMSKFYIWVEKLMSFFVDKIIVVSKKDLNLAKKYNVCPLSKMEVIHNGVRDFFDPLTIKTLNSIKIISIARFSEPKDFLTLINALKIIENDLVIKNVEIVLAGDGPLKMMIEEKVRNLNLCKYIRFVGEIHNVGNYLNESHIFILSSKSEGLPLTIIEAMSCYLPVIASDVGGINEAVKHGINGFLFKAGDADDLACKIRALIEKKGLISEMGHNSRQLYEEKFKFELMFNKTKNLYIKSKE